MRDYNTITGVTTWIAGVLATAIALLLPLGYFEVSYQYMLGSLAAEAEANAMIITQVISTNPEMWRYQETKIEGLLTQRLKDGHAETRRVLDLQDHLIAEHATPLKPPVLTQTYPLMDAGVPVANLVIISSLHPLVMRTVLVALLGLSIGCALFVSLRLLPIRAINRAEKSLRKANEFLGKVMESTTNAIFVVDRDGKIILKNRRSSEISGYSDDELIGQPFSILFSTDQFALVSEHFDKIMTQGASVSRFEAEMTCNNGRCINVECGVAPLSQEENTNSMVLSAEDITERKLVEKEREAFAAKLEISNRELQDFAYVASHDLQEPLRKIQAFGGRLCDKFGEALGGDGKDYLSRMQNAAGRMQILINDLLTFSRIATKVQPFVQVDLAEIIQGVLSDLEVKIEQTGGKVEIGELPVIDADPLQMRQVFQNLIGNALKFHKPDVAPYIQITCTILNDRRGGGASRELNQLTISDNGIGFDEKYLDRIFVPFQRLHGRSEYEGTGIGLAICKKIAERHNGSITANSHPGEGTNFILTLPTIHFETQGVSNA